MKGRLKLRSRELVLFDKAAEEKLGLGVRRGSAGISALGEGQFKIRES